jgi:ribose-phosphate pyrophosphokinase
VTGASAGCLLVFDDERAVGEALARNLAVPLAVIERHRFPDGEVKLRLPVRLPSHVILLRGLHQPNEKLVELLIAAPAARELGARRVVLVCPYLAYMRQDMAFVAGEAVSQRHIASLLASRFDAIVTVDPHLHRIDSLSDVMPGCGAVSVSAAPLIGAWLAERVHRPLLIGPDEESAPWVRAAASACTPPVDHAWCRKERLGDLDVRITLPPALDCRGRAVVLIDDMISTGHTLAAAAKLALGAGAVSVDAAATHALFVARALQELQAAGVDRIWTTDCVPHPTNAISVVPLLAETLRGL